MRPPNDVDDGDGRRRGKKWGTKNSFFWGGRFLFVFGGGVREGSFPLTLNVLLLALRFVLPLVAFILLASRVFIDSSRRCYFSHVIVTPPPLRSAPRSVRNVHLHQR